MNKVILIGRLVAAPDVRYSQGDKPVAVARYRLAVDRKFAREGEQQADFISCVALGKNGEFAERYLHKGTKIIVSGKIQTGSYTNREGSKVYTTEVLVEEHEFAESKSEAQKSREATGQVPEGVPSGDGFMGIPDGIDEELPFD